MIEWIGFVAAAMTTLCNLPQLLRVMRKRKTAGISLRMYLLLCGGLALWVVYGLLTDDLPIVIANTCSLSLAGSICLIVARKRLRKRAGP